MTTWRFAIFAVVTAIAGAACVVFFIAPPPPQIQVDQQLLPATPPNLTAQAAAPPKIEVQDSIAKVNGVAAFEEAAAAILKRAPYMAASSEGPIAGPIPLPRRRPIPR
jgi:hypothetical protein